MFRGESSVGDGKLGSPYDFTRSPSIEREREGGGGVNKGEYVR